MRKDNRKGKIVIEESRVGSVGRDDYGIQYRSIYAQGAWEAGRRTGGKGRGNKAKGCEEKK